MTGRISSTLFCFLFFSSLFFARPLSGISSGSNIQYTPPHSQYPYFHLFLNGGTYATHAVHLAKVYPPDNEMVCNNSYIGAHYNHCNNQYLISLAVICPPLFLKIYIIGTLLLSLIFVVANACSSICPNVCILMGHPCS